MALPYSLCYGSLVSRVKHYFQEAMHGNLLPSHKKKVCMRFPL